MRKKENTASRTVVKTKVSESDYAMALDLMTDLPRAEKEDVVAKRILEIFNMLFAARKISYLSIVDSKPKNFWSIPSDAGNNETKERLSKCFQTIRLTESGKGFCVKIGKDNDILAVIEIEELQFPENLMKYQNLALAMAGVLALSIENSRYYQNMLEEIFEHKQAEEALKESEERFKRLFNDLGDAVFVTKVGGTDSAQILEVNPAAEKQTGYTRDDLLKMNIAHDLSIAGSSESHIDEWDEGLVKGQKVLSVEKKRKKDGTEYWTQVVLTPIEYKGEKACLSINHDITKRKLTEIAIKKSEAQLRELNATKDKLFSIIAHDLRSPFNHILGFSELLVANVKNFEIAKSEKYLGIINSSAKNTLILLDNLLNWAKSQTGKFNFNPGKISLSNLILEILNLKKTIAKAKNISINYFSSDEIEVYADENMLKTVLRNLISNALKFTKAGGNVNILVHSIENQIEISISDNGVGINKETQNKLFSLQTNITTKGTENEK
ncbi:sensor histidine kinase, partial [Candidatus Venteria ishoeyi]|uniref:sensor histidine kinase n=1 Tax=Candidatus Venteria ishoeyi TaxID=1899563 RepID=UPI0011B0F338